MRIFHDWRSWKRAVNQDDGIFGEKMNAEIRELLLKSRDWNSFYSAVIVNNGRLDANKFKGDTFEYLTKYYLMTNPVFACRFKQVYHHSELSITLRDELKLPHPEVGVDLIAEFNDGSFCAIQCKFHTDPKSNVTYHELSTFLSITERTQTYNKLSHRLIITSAQSVTKKVGQLHPEKLGYITLSDFQSVDATQFEEIHRLILGEKIKNRPLAPRTHQHKAIERVARFFADARNDRGKIIHPCGSGKSLTAYWIAQNLQANSILIAVPSLALIKQTLSTWTKQATADGTYIDYIAVCSDQDVGKNDDPSMDTHDLGVAVTTDPSQVELFITSKSGHVKLVLTTYQSGNVVIDAAERTSHKFDLGIFDEAHKTTGDKTRLCSQLIDHVNLPIHRKLFMTATERQFKGDSSNFLSMDDEQTYGPVIDQMSLRQALTQTPPILSDYKVITVAVSRKDIEGLITENLLTKANGSSVSFKNDGSTIAALIAYKKLVDTKGIKHAISFHKSIQRATEFRDLVADDTLFDNSSTPVKAFHVSGKQSTGERNAELSRFLESEHTLVTNARCLTEGVDIPAVDAVIFADPKQSVIDIVQASGRAMRRHPDKTYGYIVIPVILDSSSTEIANDAFKQLIAVVGALGINDDRIIEEAKEVMRTQGLSDSEILEFVEVSHDVEIPFAEIVSGLQIMIWNRLSFAKSVVGESEFNKWMQGHTQLSEASMEKYTRAVRKISNDLVKLNLAFSTLEEITAEADLEELKDQYFAIGEYRDLDTRGNRMYSAGFNRLIEYQKYRRQTE